MKTFVLIPGAWMGGWVWDQVCDALRGLGHHVVPVTLPGLDRSEETESDIDLETHVEGVRSLLVERGLRQVILVGHGTAGVVAGLVTDREPDRVAHVVYVEGFLPHDGKSVLDAFSGPLRADELRSIHENHHRWPTPDMAAVWEGQGLSPEQAEWLTQRLVDHPGRPLTDRVRLTRPLELQRATYVVCRLEHFDDRLPDDVERLRRTSAWTFRYLDTGHWPMVSAPRELTAIFAEIPAPDPLPAAPDLPFSGDGRRAGARVRPTRQ
ncbi:alpha/beta fold hydrolase [Actinomadura kijaniata]|uniref:alpha/beta fold hydrolase n=1 Tax=Actinomadura kijaniata TaxID=46161 RepID=UPI003F1A9CBD